MRENVRIGQRLGLCLHEGRTRRLELEINEENPLWMVFEHRIRVPRQRHWVTVLSSSILSGIG